MDETYEELRTLRAAEWAQAQATVVAEQAARHAMLQAMPDVRDAPDATMTWSHPDIACLCGRGTFHVQRWTTVNGVKHRAELRCLACERIGTWDWADQAWCG
jgi:hypothetical protein